MTADTSINQSIINQWVAENKDTQQLQQNLAALGWDEEVIAKHLAAFKTILHEKKRFKGFFFLAAGALLGFISCVLSIINPIPALYNLILFGLTSLAILIIFLGLYYIME